MLAPATACRRSRRRARAWSPRGDPRRTGYDPPRARRGRLGFPRRSGIVPVHHFLPPVCLFSALLAAAPLLAGPAESEPAPARVETTLALALHELPPGIRPAAPEAPSPLAVEYTVDAALEAQIREILARRGLKLAQVIVMDPASGEVFA